MQSGRGLGPSQILDELLAIPGAAGLQKQAAQCRALAVCYEGRVERLRVMARATQRGYERLVHRLDPWRRRRVQFGEGVLLLSVLVAGVNLADTVELGPPLAGLRLILATLAANAAWLTLTWLAALAGRERRWTTVAWAAGAASVLAVLLAAVHGSSPHRGWPAGWGADYPSTAYGILLGLLLVALSAGAAVLIAYLEPASCAVARRRWHRALATYWAAQESKLADTRAAETATAAWLDLVRSYASEATGGSQDAVEATVALASDLLRNNRPGYPPARPLSPRPDEDAAASAHGLLAGRSRTSAAGRAAADVRGLAWDIFQLLRRS
jgi:hypothetical protein